MNWSNIHGTVALLVSIAFMLFVIADRDATIERERLNGRADVWAQIQKGVTSDNEWVVQIDINGVIYSYEIREARQNEWKQNK